MSGQSAERAPSIDAQDLFEFSPDALLVVDQQGLIHEANSQLGRLFGFSKAELIGQSVELLIPERFRQAHLAHRKDYSQKPRVRPMGAELELFGRRKDGSEFPVEITLSPVETPGGPFVLSAIRDVSDRKRAQEALKLSEARFRSIIETVTDYAIFLLDRQGHVETWSPGAEQLKGYRADEIIGQNFSRFFPPEDVAAGRPGLALSSAAKNGRFEDEGWRIRKDGSRFWANVVITAIRDENQEIRGFAKVTRNLSERRKMEVALRESEENSRLLFEFAPDAVLVSDANGRITRANARIETLFGYARGEVVGQAVELLIPERFRDKHPTHRAAYTADPRMRPMGIGLELFGLRKDGSEFPVDILLGSIETPEGRVVLSVIRDLSERRQHEEELRRVEKQKRYLEEELSTTVRFDEIVGESAALKRILKQVETVAATNATVLILGETGTGKELIARAIHNLSPRRDHAFVKLNCSAIPSGLLESELFGHEKGAFTGAIAQKIGRLELAHRGTLFLDEIGDLPLELQPKILRALQEKEFERLGGSRTIPVDIRLVAATNRDLAKMVEAQEFRSDLYYRLKVFPLEIPALRERREDIPLLVNYFVSHHARRMNRHVETVPADTMQALTNWHWPGNIRELENFIERAVILTSGPVLRVPLVELQMATAGPGEVKSSATDLFSAEREHIVRVLKESKGTIGGPGGAAERLGLKRTTLNSKMKKLGIRRSDYM